jgi:hypothetical protein
MVGIELSTRVLRALEEIEDEDVEYKELLTLYTNATKTKLITEIEREFLTQRIEVVMRTSFPRESGKTLGNKNNKPVEILEEIYHKLNEKFDFSDNLHKNGTKVGGDMIGGRSHIGWYISYKNRDGWGTSLAYRQKTPDTEPFMEVRIYQVGVKGENDERHKFDLSKLSESYDDYVTCLHLVDCPIKLLY